MKPFRFGALVHNLSASKSELIAKARRAEELGYSIFLVPDHIGDQFAPGLALAAVAGATTTLRVGSFVFCNDFRHPVMLAKEVATLDVLSDGRFEFGIGAGWMRSEYEQAGIAYDTASVRLERMEEALRIMKSLFAGDAVTFAGKHYKITGLSGQPKPAQRPHPPILLGGGGRRMLSIAAREADIVGLMTKVQSDGSMMDMSDATAAATAQKVEWVRQAAGERFAELELNIVALAVAVTDQREAAASELAAQLGMNAEHVLETPHCLVGSEEHICEELLMNRKRYGISYITVWEEYMEVFAPIVARLSA